MVLGRCHGMGLKAVDFQKEGILNDNILGVRSLDTQLPIALYGADTCTQPSQQMCFL